MSVLQGTEFYISKRAGGAIIDYEMLADGDKVAVATICFNNKKESGIIKIWSG